MPPIERVGAAHAHVLAAIHDESFEAGWPADAFVDLLAGPGVFADLICQDDEPVGFILYRVVVDEAEVLTIGVRPGWRRRGFAAHVLRAAAQRAFDAGAERFFLEVAEGNVAARALYTSLGFIEVGRRSKYYVFLTGPQDALTLEMALPAGQD